VGAELGLAELGTAFDPATAGAVHGRVTWQGDPPAVDPFQVHGDPFAPHSFPQRQVRPNPNAPRIDARTRGVADAVIFLRGIDPQRSKPWDHPPVAVQMRECQIHVCQGERDAPVGFVRRGDSLDLVSHDGVFHSLQARGAAFFTLAFPDPNQPLKRHLSEEGVVELTSGTGYYWMRAYLYCADHPYYACTDAQGRFVLTQVPPGRYEAVCWLPSWVQQRHERYPETGLVFRVFFRPPATLTRPVVLGARESFEIDFELSTADFRPPAR
jgi:hypothetical protein